MADDLFLGLDLGTTNVKALMTDAEGRVLASGGAEAPLRHPAGGVEQDIEDIWQATLAAIRRAGAGAPLARVRAIGVSSQGGALQLLDAQDRPAAPVISWLDPRGRPFNDDATARLGSAWFAERIGFSRCGVAVGQCLRLQRESPGALRPPRRIGFVGDVIVGRLCGRRAHDATSLSICMLYNPRRGMADPDVLALAGISEDQLPPLLSARTPAGELLREVATATGLPPGIPVGPAVHDQYAAALGAGVTEPGDVMLGAGTAWVLLAVSDRLLPPAITPALVCAHVAEGRYGQMLSMVNGGSAFKWTAQLTGVAGRPPEEIERLLERTPPGCAGLRFEPLLAEGGAALPAGTRGRMLGLGLAHGAGHVLRATVEGLACELTRHLRLLTAAGLPARRLVMCGGAAASRVTPQVVADTAGLPVTCRAESAMSAFGAALLARGLLDARPLGPLRAALPDSAGSEAAPGPLAPMYAALFKEYLDRLGGRS
jgi:xylulokinase